MTDQRFLAAETWTPCSVHEVVFSHLRSEWAKYPNVSAFWDRQLITDAADLSSPLENNIRATMLMTIRAGLLLQIPADTVWLRVQHLRGPHLRQLHAVNHGDWIAPGDMNELEAVAVRATQPCYEPTEAWEPILWGHDRRGPFTILEGNHRLTALMRSPSRHDVELVAYVGLSPSPCGWHRLDATQ
jgi:hypothetical protein